MRLVVDGTTPSSRLLLVEDLETDNGYAFELANPLFLAVGDRISFEDGRLVVVRASGEQLTRVGEWSLPSGTGPRSTRSTRRTRLPGRSASGNCSIRRRSLCCRSSVMNSGMPGLSRTDSVRSDAYARARSIALGTDVAFRRTAERRLRDHLLAEGGRMGRAVRDALQVTAAGACF